MTTDQCLIEAYLPIEDASEEADIELKCKE